MDSILSRRTRKRSSPSMALRVLGAKFFRADSTNLCPFEGTPLSLSGLSLDRRTCKVIKYIVSCLLSPLPSSVRYWCSCSLWSLHISFSMPGLYTHPAIFSILIPCPLGVRGVRSFYHSFGPPLLLNTILLLAALQPPLPYTPPRFCLLASSSSGIAT